MSDTAEKKARTNWKAHDVALLVRGYDSDGIAGAVGALKGDYSEAQVREKLKALGFVALSKSDHEVVSVFVERLQQHDHPTLIIDHALAELRKARKS